MEINIGIRPSPLALKQAIEAIGILEKKYPAATFSILRIATHGDRDKATPLSEVAEPDFFTKDIDVALLQGEIDFGVHSAKDLPDALSEGLELYVQTPSISPFDCLVSRASGKFKDLPSGFRIGVSSRRRKDDIRALRGDLVVVDVRGNIEERFVLIDNGTIDALIVAQAALIRLGLENRIVEVFGLDVFRTHPKQGCLAIVRKK